VDRKRKIWAAIFIVVSILGFWARYAYEKAEKRKREALFRSLATYQTERSSLAPTPVPTPDDRVEEPRDMFDSELPQEQFEQIKQTVGGDFKLMEVSISDRGLTANVSADSASVKQYERRKDRKSVEGPRDVRIIGGSGDLSDSLYDISIVNFSLVPKLSKEAVERAGIPGAKVETARFTYSIVRYKGESPEWSFYVSGGEGDAREHKFVLFDSKGKFKRVF
jgi:hypothetical protein